ncbi:MAG: AAA family ATPase, partial [Campylobacterales bacterium]|nr:AAA family ATPase [Campylobacterales bacterium]
MSENLFIKMRPLNIDEMVGQNHLVGQDGVIRKLLNKKSFPHSIFYGPPGTGKTTLAKIISKKLSLPYYELDATSLKVDEVRKIFNKHKDSLLKPLIFIDEIHRLTKTQQEVLLLPMENREFLLIGATTQNPYFSL